MLVGGVMFDIDDALIGGRFEEVSYTLSWVKDICEVVEGVVTLRSLRPAASRHRQNRIGGDLAALVMGLFEADCWAC